MRIVITIGVMVRIEPPSSQITGHHAGRKERLQGKSGATYFFVLTTDSKSDGLHYDDADEPIRKQLEESK